MNHIEEPGQTRLFYFLSLFLVTFASLGSSLWLWHFLRDFADPSGANGYFYLKQTETLASGLGFYFKDYSLSFALPVLFMKLTGDSLLSFQLAITTVWLLMVCTCGMLIQNLTKSFLPHERLFLLAAGLLALVATTQLYEFNLTFFKNAFALVMLISGFVFFYGAGSARKRIFLALMFFMAALLSHKSMLLILILAGLAWLLQNISWRRLLFVGVGFCLLLGTFLWQFEKSAAYLRVLLQFFMAPQEWWRWFKNLKYGNLEMQITLVALLLIVILYAFCRKRIKSDARILSDATALMIIVALNPFQLPGPNGPSYRLLLLAPAFAIPLCILCISHLPKRGYLGGLLLMPFMIQPFLGTRFMDDVFTPWAVIREDVLKIPQFVDPDDHLTSHHGLEFFIDYTTGIRSRSFLSNHPEKKDFRIAFVDQSWLPDPETQRALHARSLLEIGSEYILLPESDWQELVKTYAIPYHWKNPNQQRPDHIYE